MKRNNKGKTLKTVLYAVSVALVVRTFIFEPFNIPSGSMIPTLLVGDYLFVSKYSYGYSRHSLPFSLPLFSGRILESLPERGDVAVFKLPTDNKTDYIKRIIGLPGDHIQVISGLLHINGFPVQRERIGDLTAEDGTGSLRSYTQHIETLPEGIRHKIIEISDSAPFDNTREFIVPEEHYFMMGDNRDNSADSRSFVGFVPFENLVGQAEIIFFSVEDDPHFWEFWRWLGHIRLERFFKHVI